MTLPGGIHVPSALPARALLVCAAFLMAGIAAVDDYGASWDAKSQRAIANANIEFMRAGGGTPTRSRKATDGSTALPSSCP